MLLLTSSSDVHSSSMEGPGASIFNSAHLIIALPLQNGNEFSTSWERGQEILSGIQLPIASNNSNSTWNKIFVTKLVDMGKCGNDNFNYLIELINSATNQNVSLLGIVGMFCPFRVQLLLQLPIQNPTIELAIKSAYNRQWPESEQVSKMVSALLEFFTDLEWRKIGVITEMASDITYFSQLAEELYERSTQIPNNMKITVHHYQKTLTDGNFNLPRIILISLRAKSAIELLCNAYNSNLTWPKHVWMIHSYQLEDFEFSKPNASLCTLPLALENVLLFREGFQCNARISAQQKLMCTTYGSMMPYGQQLQ